MDEMKRETGNALEEKLETDKNGAKGKAMWKPLEFLKPSMSDSSRSRVRLSARGLYAPWVTMG